MSYAGVQRSIPDGCSRCYFWGGCCEFILITGRARILICKPGLECTVKATTKKQFSQRLLEYGQADYALIAELRRKAARPIRHNPTGRVGRPSSIDDMRAWKMYEEERLSDKKIAKVFGVTQNAVACWRRRNGYPSNFGHDHKLRDRAKTEPPMDE